MIMMWQCRFIPGNKCVILVGGTDHGGGCAYVGTGDICENSVPSSQFCCKLIAALKKLSLRNTRE